MAEHSPNVLASEEKSYHHLVTREVTRMVLVSMSETELSKLNKQY